MAASQHDLSKEQTIVQAMREHHVDGVIICSSSFDASKFHQFHDFGIPIVVINNQSSDEYRYSISHDDKDGSRQLARHLINLGHKKIAYLGNSSSGRTTLDRQVGFQQELAACSINIPSTYFHQTRGGKADDGQAGLQYFLSLDNQPTALMCFNDMMAIGVLKGLKEAKVKVPEDFSVTGFDNIVFSAYTNPPLTTFDQPKHFIGAESARMVLELMKTHETIGYEEPPRMRMMKGKLLVRETTAPPVR
jgi:LacI family transcriptional regulator